jgi:ferrous iron transport protein B
MLGRKKEMIQKDLRKIAIVGSPNVGKSLLFNRLTGIYVTVSNYPGTTVEISHGRVRIGGEEFEIIDTPGMYSLLPITEEEKVARNILLKEKLAVVIHIVDAKNLEKMLPLTLQLIEAKLPIILVLNIIDEAEKIGMQIDSGCLEEELKVPVVSTVSTTGRGVNILKKRIAEYAGTKK